MSTTTDREPFSIDGADRRDGPRSPRGVDRWDLASVVLVVAAFLVTAAVYHRLPDRVPVHFDLHARPDGWLGRATGAWLLPVLTLVVAAIVRLGAVLLPPAWRARLQASPLRPVVTLLVGLFTALQLVILHASLHPDADVALALYGSLAVFWMVLAQLMPRLRRNPFVGVRTTWTLTSDENWARTHRFGGQVMTAGGIVALLAALGSRPAVSVIALLVSGVVPAVYSFVLARRLRA